MPQDGGCRIMDGAGVARGILGTTARRSEEYLHATGTVPALGTVLVGDDPASVKYIELKRTRCREAGLRHHHTRLPESASTAEVVEVLEALSRDPAVHGVFLQYPLPDHVDERAAFEAIDPAKDVDGATTRSFGATALGLPGFAACTPAGIMRLLATYAVDPAGRRAVVVGAGPTLARPVGMLLLNAGAAVTFCEPELPDLVPIVRAGDIVVAAAGRPGLVRGSWIKPGAAVIDAGYTNRDGGDVRLAEVRTVAGSVAPVPGGVGPMTVALLLEQTVDAAFAQAGLAQSANT